MPDLLKWARTPKLDADAARRWERRLPRKSGQNWVFRGISSPEHPLTSTLDRCAEAWKARKRPFASKAALEAGIHRAFVRHAALYRSSHLLPPEDDLLGWLSLMRHYGAPTRILDFTYSFWVAAFFAVAEGKPTEDAIVVAIDATWLDRTAEAGMSEHAKAARLADQHGRSWRTFEAVYGPGAGRFVHRQNAWLRNERVTAQQGLFLVPSDVETTFEENLREMLTRPGAARAVRHIRVDGKKRVEFIEHLHRGGIERSTIYPGELAEFAKSLGELAGIPHVIVPLDGQDRWLGKGDGPT